MSTDHKPTEDNEMQYREELDAAMDDIAARKQTPEPDRVFYVDPPDCPKCGRPATAMLGIPREDGRREAWCAFAHVWLAREVPA